MNKPVAVNIKGVEPFNTLLDVVGVCDAQESIGHEPAQSRDGTPNDDEIDEDRAEDDADHVDKRLGLERHRVCKRCKAHKHHQDRHECWIISCPLILCLFCDVMMIDDCQIVMRGVCCLFSRKLTLCCKVDLAVAVS